MYLNQLGVVCALGATTTEVWRNAVAGSQQGMQSSDLRLVDASPLIVGQVADEFLPNLAEQAPLFQTRNNRLAAAALANL